VVIVFGHCEISLISELFLVSAFCLNVIVAFCLMVSILCGSFVQSLFHLRLIVMAFDVRLFITFETF